MSTTYEQTLQWMYGKLPAYQRIGQKAFKKDLTNIREFANRLGQPHLSYATIHVAGTNGKGSVSSMLASVLQEAGYKTGLYTSPHLKDFRERIRINGEMISKDYVIYFIDRHRDFLEKQQLSFFEMTVGMAFQYFHDMQVDVAVIETGLGGRLDSTNIIRPELSIITNVHYDHTDMLGDTLAKIAREKAGIIKTGTPVVIGEKHPETEPVFWQTAQEKKAEIFWAEDFKIPPLQSDLKGTYQRQNIRTVWASIDILRKRDFKIPPEAIERGLLHVQKNTGLRGRWEILSDRPFTVADTAHNPHAFREVMEQLKTVPHEQAFFVLGFVEGKDLEQMIDFIPQDAQVFLSRPAVLRGRDPNEVAQIFERKGLRPEIFRSIRDAFDKARSLAAENDLIYVGGSTFTVAEIL